MRHDAIAHTYDGVVEGSEHTRVIFARLEDQFVQVATHLHILGWLSPVTIEYNVLVQRR